MKGAGGAKQALLHARAITEWIHNESMVESLKPLLPSALLLRGQATNVVLARACPWINSSASGVASKGEKCLLRWPNRAIAIHLGKYKHIV